MSILRCSETPFSPQLYPITTKSLCQHKISFLIRILFYLIRLICIFLVLLSSLIVFMREKRDITTKPLACKSIPYLL